MCGFFYIGERQAASLSSQNQKASPLLVGVVKTKGGLLREASIRAMTRAWNADYQLSEWSLRRVLFSRFGPLKYCLAGK